MLTILFRDDEVTAMKDFFALPDETISVTRFGVDVNFWSPGATQAGYILAVGNDGNRDLNANLLFFRSGDQSDLAAQVRRSLDDSAFAQKIAKAGRETVREKDATIEQFAARLKGVCQSALDQQYLRERTAPIAKHDA